MSASMEKLLRQVELLGRNRTHFVDVEEELDRIFLDATPPAGSFSPQYVGSKPELLWLLDNTAFTAPDAAEGAGSHPPWRAEFVTAAFRPSLLPDDGLGRAVAALSTLLGLTDNVAERTTLVQRLGPFLWPLDPACHVTAELNDHTSTGTGSHPTQPLDLGATNVNGIASVIVPLPPAPSGSLVTSRAVDPDRRLTGLLQPSTFYAGPSGWAVISDIDDTIKITQTATPLGILRQTFALPPTPVPGMPELYAALQKTVLPPGSAWLYLSASPYNLYPFLRDFRARFYPPGTVILRDASLKTLSGLLTNLTLGTLQYKVDRMRKAQSWLPGRRVLAIGDSTQTDPEAYGEIYRSIPGWIHLILIRRVTNIAEVGLHRRNDPARFENAFQGVPRSAWHVFDDPAECLPLVIEAVRAADAADAASE